MLFINNQSYLQYDQFLGRAANTGPRASFTKLASRGTRETCVTSPFVLELTDPTNVVWQELVSFRAHMGTFKFAYALAHREEVLHYLSIYIDRPGRNNAGSIRKRIKERFW